MDRAVLFVDGRYTLQVRDQVDLSIFTIAHLVDLPPSRWIEQNVTAGERIGYDPWLHTVEARRAPGQGLQRSRRDAGSGRGQSDRRDLARPARPPLGPSRCTTCASPARTRRASSPACSANSPSCKPTRWWCPTRTPWPGCSTSAAPTSRIRRCRSPSRSCRRRTARALCRRPQAVERRAPPSRGSRRCARACRFRARSRKRSVQQTRTVRLDQATAADALARLITERRRQGRARRRSDRDDEGGEEPGRRSPARAPRIARRRRGGALPRLVRSRGAAGPAHRDRRRRGAGKLPPRHRAAQGRVVPDHRRRRSRTAPSCTTASPQRPTGRSCPANCS